MEPERRSKSPRRPPGVGWPLARQEVAWTTRRELSANLGVMASPKSPKDKFLVNIINPYLAEVKRHPQTLWVEDGVLHKEDLKGPVKEGSTRARLEEVEQEVFKYKLMIKSGVEANYDIIVVLNWEHEEEMKEV
ncbi:40s ribosomal protein s5-1 [Hordeum vulgare]|nr:40s ribosomal protein s5-1 [Hordeum vulgare]